MLQDNPLLTLLGRRGRGAVLEALRRAPGRAWSVRDLARTADVAPMVASRTVRELLALAAVTVTRPGRDLRVRLRTDSVAGAYLAALALPDLEAEVQRVFAAAMPRVRGTLVGWRQPGDDPADPLRPARIAALVPGDAAVDEALAAAGPALDAVRAAGLPPPDFSVWVRDSLGDDEVARALRAGRQLAR